MTGTSIMGQTNNTATAAYSAESDLVDYILGITFEIWEQRQVELIHDYYAQKVEVYGLDGMTNSATAMVDNTFKTLAAYPDRLLLADDVITSGTTKHGLSSHRLTSPMTNLGDTPFGDATGRKILAMNIADCEVTDGMITREWLVRDNLAVIRQLGFDPMTCARVIADQLDKKQIDWLASEYARTRSGQVPDFSDTCDTGETVSFAKKTLGNCWVDGNNTELEAAYAPYCVMQRAPLQRYSGREATLEHYKNWRAAFPDARLCVDHVCSQPFDQNNQRIAVRWSVAGQHKGEFAGRAASDKPVYILGVTHWQIVDGRIASEWTIFDELAVLAQTLD